MVPQVNALTEDVTVEPVPLRLTELVDALFEIVSCPVKEFAVVGANLTVSTAACPGFSVTGRLPPETENPVPEIESELIVTAAVPLEVRVTDFEAELPTETFPNASEVELNVRAGADAFNCKAKLLEEALALAVRVTVCVPLTEFTFAVNDDEVAPEGTVTLLGTVTALLPLATATV